MIRLKQHCTGNYIHVYKQHCADEPGSTSALRLAAGFAVSFIVLVIAVVYIAAIVIWWR